MEASEVLNRITKAKRSQVPLLPYVISQDEVLGQKIKWCGSWLHFREWITSNESRLINANFCKKHLLCQACAVRRAGKMNEAYLPKVESMLAAYPKIIPAMITLTVKNGDNLTERIDHFKGSWKRMLDAKRKAQSNSKKNSPVEWNKVVGSLRAMEVTRSKDDEWHPHAHVFTLLTDYIDQRKLSHEWERFTGDSKIVGVTKCRGGVKAGLLEVLKYSCKFSSMTPEQTYEVYQACNGSRLIDPQGLLRGISEPDIDSDDISGMTGAYRDFIAHWMMSQQKFRVEYIDDSSPSLPVNPRPRSASVSSLPPLKLNPPCSASQAYSRVMLQNRKPAD